MSGATTAHVPDTSSRSSRRKQPGRAYHPSEFRLVRKGEFTVHTPKCPAIVGDSCFAKTRSLGWNFFENPDKSRVSHYVNLFILACIIASAIVMCVESTPGIHKKNTQLWDGLEAFFVLTFSVEFIIRIVCCPDYPSFFKSGMNYVDFFSILPWYLKLALGDTVNLAFLRILRLGRALRLVKLSRYSSGVRLITRSLTESLDALYLFLFILLILVIVCSSAVYYTERGTYDEATETYMREDPYRGYKCCAGTSTAPCEAGTQAWAYPNTHDFTCKTYKTRSPFQSITETFWWCVVTLTTVGYGDDYPVTYLGQVFGVLTQLIGVVTLALPLSIIGSNFIDERQKQLEEQQSSSLDDRNTVPGEHKPIQFMDQRLNLVLERMDLFEEQIARLAKQSEMSVIGAIKLNKQFEGGQDFIDVNPQSIETMKLLVSQMQDTIDTIKPHLI